MARESANTEMRSFVSKVARDTCEKEEEEPQKDPLHTLLFSGDEKDDREAFESLKEAIDQNRLSSREFFS